MESPRRILKSIIWPLILLLSGASVAMAQEIPLDGSRPPAISLSEAMMNVDAETEGGSGLPMPPPQAPSSDGAVADAIRRQPGGKKHPPPPQAVTLEPGRNATYGISKHHINRFVTPFAKPTLRTTSTATTSIEGSILYVASNVEAPIGLFVYDESAPEMAISLTLVPRDDIPPVSTTITLAGWQGGTGAVRRPASRPEALAREARHPYLETITSVLRDVAKGIVPDGYGFEVVDDRRALMLPTCQLPGLVVKPMQLLTGAAYQVVVARVRNASFANVELREDQCRSHDLRAVAAWPHTLLGPGQETELYLVLGMPGEDNSAPARPSVIGGL